VNHMLWDHLRQQQLDQLRKQGVQVLDSKVPDRDSQFRLRACKACGSEEPVYIKLPERNGKLWRVRCLGCFAQTQGHQAVHDAQMEWNMHKGVIPVIRRAF